MYCFPLYLNLCAVMTDSVESIKELSVEEIRERITLLQMAVKMEVRKMAVKFDQKTPERELLKSILDTSRATFDKVRDIFEGEIGEVPNEGLSSFLNHRIGDPGLSFSGEEDGVRLDSKNVEVVDGATEEFEIIKMFVLEFLETRAKKGSTSTKLLELLVDQPYGERISILEGDDVIAEYKGGVKKLIANTNQWILSDMGLKIFIRNGMAILGEADSVLRLEKPVDDEVDDEVDFKKVKGNYERSVCRLADLFGKKLAWRQMVNLVCDNAIAYESDGSDYEEVEDRFSMIDGMIDAMTKDADLRAKGFKIYVVGDAPAEEDGYDERMIRIRFAG